jgi:hypothetical protein
MPDDEHDIPASYSPTGTVSGGREGHFPAIFRGECLNKRGDQHFPDFTWREKFSGPGNPG